MGQGLAASALALLALTACGNDGRGSAAAQAADSPVERGRYLVAIMDCVGCHNKGAFSPKPEDGFLEGSPVGFSLPNLGIFWPPNLTPHPDAGIGRWSEAEIVTALRTGMRPDGRQLAPVMPWKAYRNLTDADAQAIAAYLKTLPPSPNRVPAPAQPDTATAPFVAVTQPPALTSN